MDKEYTENGYFDLISHNRLKNSDQTEMLQGEILVSIETSEEHATASIQQFIHDNPVSFFRALRQLPSHFQDLVISYYVLNKTQDQLAAQLMNTSQTITSTLLRKAVQALCALLQWPDGLTEEVMNKILKNRELTIGAALKHTKDATITMKTVSAARVLFMLLKYRSFELVATAIDLWRAELRRVVRELVKELCESEDRDEKLLGGALYIFLDAVGAKGTGKSLKALRRTRPYEGKDPACLGNFRVRIGEPGWEALFPAHSFV
jgi:hypothetical protein